MAKIKPAQSGKSKGKNDKKPSALQAIPCLLIILGGMALLVFLFYGALRSN